MAKNKEKGAEMTNVMRTLTQKKIPFIPHEYDPTVVNGVGVAAILGQRVEQVYKTLVTQAASKKYYVFVIPVAKELDLKAAARAVSEKSIDMIPQKELLPLTGYIHGGCSPVGMKKLFPTVVDESARTLESFCVSAGKVGHQVQLAPADLQKAVPFTYAPVARDPVED